MKYASVLLHVEDSPHRGATEVALDLCSPQGAVLTALHVSIPGYHDYVESGKYPVAPNEASIEQEKVRAEEADERLEAEFDTQARHRGGLETEWRFHQGEQARTHLASTLALHAQCADLVVMEQHDGRDRGSQTTYDTPAMVAIDSGRPVCVLPHGGHCKLSGGRAIVAWDGSNQATRAATFALPLLERFDSVEIVMVNEGKRMDSSPGKRPGEDLALYLARHGIETDVRELERNGSSVAETLLSAVAESDAQLLCMGVYGHSRLREMTFGGATFDLMRYMRVPMLIAG